MIKPYYKLPVINRSPWPLERSKGAAVGFDLRANIEAPITLFPQMAAQLIPTGIHIDMTSMTGMAAFIYPRSGLGHKSGLVMGNGTGVIDTDYHGELMISAWNRNSPLNHGLEKPTFATGGAIVINPGDRIAQLVFVHTWTFAIEPSYVEAFDSESVRGADGFGSSGVSS